MTLCRAGAPREQQRERLAELLKTNELGLVMFKDAREPAAPDVYGKLIGADAAADDSVGQGHVGIDRVREVQGHDVSPYPLLPSILHGQTHAYQQADGTQCTCCRNSMHHQPYECLAVAVHV